MEGSSKKSRIFTISRKGITLVDWYSAQFRAPFARYNSNSVNFPDDRNGASKILRSKRGKFHPIFQPSEKQSRIRDGRVDIILLLLLYNPR